MIISIVNHTDGKITDEQIHDAIRSINRQIKEDFESYWSMGATLRLEGASTKNPDKIKLVDIRGDAILYIWDKVDIPNAKGYHEKNNRGIPYGFVFMELSEKLQEDWTVTLSHEALELIADPEANLYVIGPHPDNPQKMVFHWYEMCDAVQNEHYEIDGIKVSNFLLPLYFTSDEEKGSRNDFLGREYSGKTLKSFGINPGGYIGFYDPETKENGQSFGNDPMASKRFEIKRMAGELRRAARYENAILPKKQ